LSRKFFLQAERCEGIHSGKPENNRTDNGTEFLAKAYEGFCKNSQITHFRIQKGKPMQKGYVERFNKTFREDVWMQSFLIT